MQPQSSKAAHQRPLLNVVLAIPPKKEGERTRYAPLGTGYPHRKGEGFNLELDSLPLDWGKFLAFPRTSKADREAGPAEVATVEAERFTVYVPLRRDKDEAGGHRTAEAKDKEFLSPCGVAFPHEKGGGFTIHLNALPRDWTRLVVLPEAVEPRAEAAVDPDLPPPPLEEDVP